MKLFRSIFLFFSITGMAQNWCPVNSVHTYNYFTGPAFSSASIVRTDSFKMAGTDSVLYLNLVKKSIPGSTSCLRNQPQFLGKVVIKKNNGLVTFRSNTAFTLNSLANPGDTWTFDTLNNYTATVIQASTANIMGQTDSVKTIVSNNADTLVLSKNYGIVFCHLTNSSAQSLQGIQNAGMGFHVPGYKDFYDFSAGDVLEYQSKYDHADMHTFYNNYSDINRYKVTILSKTISGNTITYIASRLFSDTLTGWQQPPSITQNLVTDTLVYTDSASNFLNGYNHEIFNTTVPCLYGGYNGGGRELHFGYNSLFLTYTKETVDTSYTPIQNTDTLLSYMLPCDAYQVNGAGFGVIYSYQYIYSSGTSDTRVLRLTGSIKGGITYGTITPDWRFYSALSDVKQPELKIAPVPADNFVAVNGLKNNCQAYVYSGMGGILLEKNLSEEDNRLNISSLPAGVYFIKLVNNYGELSVKKLIKN